MAMRKAAVIPCRGIGDALLMMIASHGLLQKGYAVTTFHPALKELQRWFPDHHFAEAPPLDLSSYDLVIVENDNSPRIQELIASPQIKKLSIFYPTYSADRHAPLSLYDQAFRKELCMADNLAEAISRLLQAPLPKDNGLVIPEGLVYRKYPQRIIIHPTSSQSEKNWTQTRYLQLEKKLRQKNFQPLFTLAPHEKKEWSESNCEILACSSLDELAKTVYESGYMIGNDSLLGHLASNLGIPTLIIANDAKRMQLWRPGWFAGEVITPRRWIPNWKGLRLRQKQWQWFISVGRVFETFQKCTRDHKPPSLLQFPPLDPPKP